MARKWMSWVGCLVLLMLGPTWAEPYLVRDFVLKDVILVDVRTPAEYDAGHLDGAINLPFEEILKLPQLVSITNESPIVVYCASGERAKKAMQSLVGAGFTRVTNAGGYEALKQQDSLSSCCGCCSCSP